MKSKALLLSNQSLKGKVLEVSPWMVRGRSTDRTHNFVGWLVARLAVSNILAPQSTRLYKTK